MYWQQQDIHLHPMRLGQDEKLSKQPDLAFGSAPRRQVTQISEITQPPRLP